MHASDEHLIEAASRLQIGSRPANVPSGEDRRGPRGETAVFAGYNLVAWD